ncbi:MAG: helicase-related protein [Erysipelotrichaceae bacterium]
MMECERCGNVSPRYFAIYRGKPVCRRCIGYTGEDASIDITDRTVEAHLAFDLTPAQAEASTSIKTAIKTKDVLVNAVCGAGKTELVYDTIAMYLSQSKTVGLAIARRQVVLQLAKRLASAFPTVHVQAICEGQSSILNAQLFIVTTHQLYRFHAAFDCLILDEPDAFPFVGDPLLAGFARKACRGHTIYLTATPDWMLRRKVKVGEMVEIRVNRRPHGHPLPEPHIIVVPYLIQILMLMRWMRTTPGRKLIFTPTIKMAGSLSKILKIPYVSSQSNDLEDKIRRFIQTQESSLISTTVLERGVTFENVQVCVIGAHHKVFTPASLIQIAGRAGRSPAYPGGEVLFLCSKRTRNLRACLHTLVRANKDACYASPP